MLHILEIAGLVVIAVVIIAFSDPRRKSSVPSSPLIRNKS